MTHVLCKQVWIFILGADQVLFGAGHVSQHDQSPDDVVAAGKHINSAFVGKNTDRLK
jgi:hypothetical protein